MMLAHMAWFVLIVVLLYVGGYCHCPSKCSKPCRKCDRDGIAEKGEW